MRRILSGAVGVDDAEQSGGGCGTRLDAELSVDVLQVLAHRARRQPQELGDLRIRLAERNPGEHLVLARGQLGFGMRLAKEKCVPRALEGEGLSSPPPVQWLAAASLEPADDGRWKTPTTLCGEVRAQETVGWTGGELDSASRAEQDNSCRIGLGRSLQLAKRSREEATRPRRLPQAGEVRRQEVEYEAVALAEVTTKLSTEDERLGMPRRRGEPHLQLVLDTPRP